MTTGEPSASSIRTVPFWLKIALGVMILSAVLCLVVAVFVA